jgi:hypothetical protein
MALYKIMISQHENLYVVCWNGIHVPGCKLSGYLNDVECMTEGGDGRLSEERDDLQLRCHLYVRIIVVWCYESLHLVLKLQGPILETADLQITDQVVCLLKVFPQSTSSQLRPLYHSITIFIFWSIEHVKVSVNYAAACELQGCLSLQYLGILFFGTLPVNPRMFVILSRWLGTSESH